MTPSRDELREALDEYVEDANSNERARKTMSNWECLIQFEANDSDAAFTMQVTGGEISSVDDGLQGEPDLKIEAAAQELLDIFWGEENPAERYNQGAVVVRGSQEHLMRLDAMAMLVFLST